MDKRVILPAVCAVLCCFSGCSRSAYHILSGTLQWSGGNYDSAVYSFLSAETAAEAEENSRNGEYAQYGLAACYYELNEPEAAVAVLDELRNSPQSGIAGFAWYADGLLAYKAQEYDRAAECFKKSLQYDAAPADARINLELSLEAARNEPSPVLNHGTGAGDSPEKSGSRDPLSQILRNREEQQWKSMYHDVPPQAQDY